MSICFRCGQPGHYARDCQSKDKICFTCGQPGHKSSECPDRQSRGFSGGGGGGVGRCYSCGEMGHRAIECPTKPMSKTCYKCGQQGHFARDCYEAEPKCFTCGRPGHKGHQCPERQNQGYYNQGGKLCLIFSTSFALFLKIDLLWMFIFKPDFAILANLGFTNHSLLLINRVQEF